MNGGTGDDVQYGGDGNDTIFANIGQDTTYGGDGNDTLWALARSDVHPGANGVDPIGDTLDGGAGDDTFRTRDGEVDQHHLRRRQRHRAARPRSTSSPTPPRPTPTARASASCARRPSRRTRKTEDAQQSPKDAQVQN